MGQYVDTNTKSFTAGAALARGTMVKLSSDKLAAAGVADRPIGVMLDATFADLDVGTVQLLSKAGTMQCIAADAIVSGAVVYTAASGKVSDTAATGATELGIALEGVDNADSLVEVMPT